MQPGHEAREAGRVLLQVNPELCAVLCYFSAPGKIGLAAFVGRKFRFKLDIKSFTYLAGHHLATFKRDFKRRFR